MSLGKIGTSTMADKPTASDILQFVLDQQRGTLLNSAESMLEELESYVRRLKNEKSIGWAPNIISFGRLLADHASYKATEEALRIAKNKE